MDKRLILPAIVSTVLGTPLLSQTDFGYILARHGGNKIVLLGEWKPSDSAEWKETIDSDGVYEHGFTLLDRSSFAQSNQNILGVRNIEAFETWFRRQYSLDRRARWAALDLENRLITSGANTPEAGQLEQLLDQRGIKSPLRILRDFLRENPDHLDAKTDLLKEVRRRALHKIPDKMPDNVAEDLDTESDLRTWGVLAAETDRVFSGSWLGADLNFFRPDRDQPERYSKLMRAVFAKHISKVESAIRIEPINTTLWNIWAWMARSLPDYKWERFISSFEPFTFFNRYMPPPDISVPSSEVCVWIVAEARAKKDWDTVIKYAKIASEFIWYAETPTIEWKPSGSIAQTAWDRLQDYPAKSAYAPHLEALLRLGDIEGANNLFDEMIRIEGKTASWRHNNDSPPSNNALIAANVARAVGMEELAKIWEQGEQINKVPYAREFLIRRTDPAFCVFSKASGDYVKNFGELTKRLSPALSTSNTLIGMDTTATLGWKEEDEGHRWALLDLDGKVLAQGFDMPELDELQGILNRLNIKNYIGRAQEYIAKHGSAPGIEYWLALRIISDNTWAIRTVGNNQDTTPLDESRDEELFGTAVGYLNKLLTGHPEILVNCPLTYSSLSGQSPLIKGLANSMLTNIESFLDIKPSSTRLWSQWLSWSAVGGNERPLEPIVERVKASPLARPGTVPPSSAMDRYYQECIKNGNWPKVIGLLKTVWDRELSRITTPKDEQPMILQIGRGGMIDRVAVPLIEAYLHENKPGEADGIFNSVIDSGSNFTDISKTLELAKTKGYESLAGEWERKVKK